jgi:hypothetical protein
MLPEVGLAQELLRIGVLECAPLHQRKQQTAIV